MILTGVILTLFAAWMLLLWMFGESCDIRWLRNWCAGIFVCLAIFLCLGGGVWMTRKWLQADYRRNVQTFSDLLLQRLDDGRTQDVEDAIRHLAGKTNNEWEAGGDILQRLAQVNAALEKTARVTVAEKPESVASQ
jgi:hypothetical protein